MRTISLAYLTVDGAQPVEQIEAAAAGGFTAAGLRIVAPSHLALREPVVGNQPLLRAIRDACRNAGIAVFDVEVVTLSPTTPVAGYFPALDAAAEIGASFVQTVCEDPDAARAADQFAALCDACAARGLRASLEFMWFRNIKTLEQAGSLVRRAGRPNGGVLVDALHLSRSGGGPESVKALPADLIAYMQLCDAPAQLPPPEDFPREARTARLQPGAGTLPLHALLDALPPDLPISVEVPTAESPGLSFEERARRAGEATRAFLSHRL